MFRSQGILVALVISSAFGLFQSCEKIVEAADNPPSQDSSLAPKGPAATLALAQLIRGTFTLQGTIENSGKTTLRFAVKSNSGDSATEFDLPAPQIITGSFDLSGISFRARSTATPGAYSLVLTATGPNGSTTISCPFTFAAPPRIPPPQISFITVSSRTNVEGGETISFRANVSYQTKTAFLKFSVVRETPNSSIHEEVPSILRPADDQIQDSIRYLRTGQSGNEIVHELFVPNTIPTSAYTLWIKIIDEYHGADSTSITFTAYHPDTSVLLNKSTGLQLGAQLSPAGSFLQISGGEIRTWTSAYGKPYEHLDLVFGTDGSGVLSLMSPNQANEDGFDLSSWPVTNKTIIKDLGFTLLLESRTELATALASSTMQKCAVEQWHYYGLALADGSYAVVLVTDLSSQTRNATATIDTYR
ncbi:MAG: hypothetical protein IPK50_12045 [Fibrobacterota bacterium]|nr:MAG: hypothetical protein IPK50_12045 [Fibrobacterota bacterium]